MENVIESFEYYDYRTPLSEDINEPGAEFPIVVYNEDIVTHPHKSKLIINGKLNVKKAGATAADPATDVTAILPSKIHFIYNAILHLFDRIDYYIGDNKVDFIRKPGYAATLKNLVSMRHHIHDNDIADDAASPILFFTIVSFALFILKNYAALVVLIVCEIGLVDELVA
ncbi:hypothetical protein U1Q18_050214 [Sarracenia purpurea var. burkii]